jgi:hypothetical protein
VITPWKAAQLGTVFRGLPTDGRKTAVALLRRWRAFDATFPSLSQKRLRAMNKGLFSLWIFPGIPVSIYLRNSIAWVVFLSVYAIIIAHLIEWRQEASHIT